MTVSRKHKRPIHVAGEGYLWWVARDEPLLSGSSEYSLCVVSESGDLYIRYFLGQPDDYRHVVVIGRRFRAVAGCGNTHRRFLCPSFGILDTVAPANVASMISWAVEAGENPLEVDARGRPRASAVPT